VDGLSNNSALFPQPPASPEVLKAAMANYKARLNEAIQARAAALAATIAKQEALDNLVAIMKSDLRYAELITNRNDASLKALGWSAPRPKKPQPAPGQPGTLRIVEIGDRTLSLCWNAPAGGGRVLMYVIQRRVNTESRWREAASVLETAATLTDQPTGEVLEYRVVAMNKSGSSLSSNSITVKL